VERGVIFRAVSGFYYVETENGRTLTCRARGRLRRGDVLPLVGDRVSVLVGGGGGVVTELAPRKNAFARPAIANVDQLIIVVSAAVPVTDPYLIDRMSLVAHSRDCRALICINKCDLDAAGTLFDIYSKSGIEVIRGRAGAGRGREKLLEALAGKVSVFTGNSGVGKSSIINMLEPELSIAVGEISRKLGRGRHTTRSVDLYKISGGAVVADTPGFSSFDAELAGEIKRNEIMEAFPDFAPYLGKCRFDDCLHLGEPGCAVALAVSAGSVHRSRYASYARLCSEASPAPWEKKRR
jgi:ribosome biogenesis GTPase